MDGSYVSSFTPHDDGVGVILCGGGEDHLLGTGLQVGLHLLGCQEHAGGLTHVLSTMLAKRDLSRVAGVGQGHLLAVNDQGVTIHLGRFHHTYRGSYHISSCMPGSRHHSWH